MAEHGTISLDRHVLHLLMTDASDGDLSSNLASDDRAATRTSIIPGKRWTQLRQVHGAGVVAVDHPGHNDNAVGDALVTCSSEAVLAIQVADCVPVALWSSTGAFALVHAGWKGTATGVIEEAAISLRSLMPRSDFGDAGEISALVGYCICAACYEFGADDLRTMVARFGPHIQSRTNAGTPALDMRAAVTTALTMAGVDKVEHLDRCTSCSPGLWSHRARGDLGRQALVGWLESTEEPALRCATKFR